MPNTHENFPDRAKTALLLIDVINDLSFPGSGPLIEQADTMATKLAALKRAARKYQVPAIYVNDNFGQWKSDFRSIVEHCINPSSPGASISRKLKPRTYDYFVLKPMHSGFYSTSLDILLEYLHVDTLIITGIATNICVLFTANDAYMREYSLFVPCDCVAANTPEETQYALEQMQTLLKADVRPSTEIKLESLSGRRRSTTRKRSKQR
jgi:nicotinamidase-related amidase